MASEFTNHCLGNHEERRKLSEKLMQVKKTINLEPHFMSIPFKIMKPGVKKPVIVTLSYKPGL